MTKVGSGKKKPKYHDDCVSWLTQLSKAALIDCVVDLLRTDNHHHCDDSVSEEDAQRRLADVLIHRGDRIPKI